MTKRSLLSYLILPGFLAVLSGSLAAETMPTPAAPPASGEIVSPATTSVSAPSLDMSQARLYTYQDPQLQSAGQDIEKGDWRTARTKAETVLNAHKKSAEAWVVLGRTYLANRQYKKAIRRFHKALKYEPHYAAGYYWDGKAYEALGKIDEAANEYQAAFHADPQLEMAKADWRRLRDHAAVRDE